VCEQLAQSRYVKGSGRDSNLRPLGCKSDVLTTTPRRHNNNNRSEHETFRPDDSFEVIDVFVKMLVIKLIENGKLTFYIHTHIHITDYTLVTNIIISCLGGSVVERWSLTRELSLVCTGPAADG